MDNKHNILKALKTQLYNQTPVIGAWVRRAAVKALTRHGSAEALRLLGKAVTQIFNPPIADTVFHTLQQLAEQGNRGAQDALCHLVIVYDHPRAREHVMANQYAPTDPHQRALFLFLTEQWERYDLADADQHLLRELYPLLPADVRQRLRTCAKQAARIAWVDVVSGEPWESHLDTLTDEDWDVILSILTDHHAGHILWQLAQRAPAIQSARLFRHLQDSDWMPTAHEERLALTAFTERIDRCRREQDFGLPEPMECYRTLAGHTEQVHCVAISPDGRLLASGGGDHSIRLWGLPDGATCTTLNGHTHFITCLAISPDGTILASGSDDCTGRLWHLPDGAALQTLKGHTGGISCMAISPDGRLLATGSEDHVIQLWSVADGVALHKLEAHTYTVRCLAISPDGQVLVSGSGDSTVRLWSLPDGELLRTLEGHSKGIGCIAISPDGQLLVSSGGDRFLRLWRLPDGEALQTLEGHEMGISSLAISPDGRLLASGGGDLTVRLWSLPDGAALHTLEGGCWFLGMSPDGRTLVSSRSSDALQFWSVPDGIEQPFDASMIDPSPYSPFAISPDGRVLAQGGGDIVLLWNMWKLQVRRVSQLPLHQTTQEDIRWVQETLQTVNVTQAERAWLEFLLALMRWHQHHEIEQDETPQDTSVK